MLLKSDAPTAGTLWAPGTQPVLQNCELKQQKKRIWSRNPWLVRSNQGLNTRVNHQCSNAPLFFWASEFYYNLITNSLYLWKMFLLLSNKTKTPELFIACCHYLIFCWSWQKNLVTFVLSLLSVLSASGRQSRWNMHRQSVQTNLELWCNNTSSSGKKER